MNILTTILLLLAVIANVMPLVRRDEWWIRAFDFPRYLLLQFLLACTVLFVSCGPSDFLVNVVVLLTAVAAALYQVFTLFPYSRLAALEAQSASANNRNADTLSILVANVLMSNRNTDGLLEIVKREQPDMLLLLEPDEWWDKQLPELRKMFKWHVADLRDNLYGMALYSRLELIEPRVEYLLKKEIPSIHCHVKLQSGRKFRLYCLHPEPPAPGEADSSAPRDAELLICADRIRARSEATVVAGDLNDVAWSHSNNLFQKISGLLDPRKGRGAFNTFNARRWWLRWPLDHVFHTSDFVVADLRRLEHFGSDHFPIFIKLQRLPASDEVEDIAPPNAEERGEMVDIVARGIDHVRDESD